MGTQTATPMFLFGGLLRDSNKKLKQNRHLAMFCTWAMVRRERVKNDGVITAQFQLSGLPLLCLTQSMILTKEYLNFFYGNGYHH